MKGEMDFSQNPKNNIKKRLGPDQVRLLEASFDPSRKLDPERKFQLARQLAVPPRQIAIWYQNKRVRWRSQSLELDYGSLQARLEVTLADKERLEMEVEGLRGELMRAREMLVASFGQAEAQLLEPVNLGWQSISGDEGAASSSINHDNVGVGLEFEELYARLMAGNGDKGYNDYDEGNLERDFWE